MGGEKNRENLGKYIVFAIIALFAMPVVCGAEKNVSINSKNSVSATAKSGGVSVSGDVSGPVTVETGDASASVDAVIVTNGDQSSVKAEAKAEAGGKKAEVKKETSGTGEEVSFRETVENGGAKATVEVSQSSAEESENPPTEIEENDTQAENKQVVEDRKGGLSAVAESIVSAVKNTFGKIIDFFFIVRFKN